ncbi:MULTISPECIES: GNAT family N-acetyltransferase [Clostridium]|uniref:GNAT family N-acetyltransferase n=1 Tax=Clostridium cibarium TaxID=2762247 RepID=A0ABR8PYJ0_9CLOT|nr:MULTISPECIES: GNAT family N-acetyltransferase [Clostridium]MBD7913229.1 GNAT family N-acetyltransferase [Clostridium cibarium]
MITVERLNNNNFSEFNNLIRESKRKTQYSMDFYKFYDNKTFIYKYIIRKMVHLIKVDRNFVGYIWVESPSYQSTRLSDIFIKDEYMNYFSSSLPLMLKSTVVTYECFEDSYTLSLLHKLNMSRIRLTYLMKLSSFTKENSSFHEDIAFHIYDHKKDAKTRCYLQNSIFMDNNRVPLTVEDIRYDEKQDYYLKDLSLFIYKGVNPIGYGQIIYSRGIYLIVNFGILEGYRGRGYGADLINKLISLAKSKGIMDIYIRVDFNNNPAIALYRNVGFKDVGNFSTWVWSKNLM